jgi:hypothetical protein
MSFDTELKAHIAADAAISALISGRFTPGVVPEGSEKPASSWRTVSGEPRNSIDGHTGGLRRYRIQIDHWSARYDQALEIAAAFKTRMATATTTLKTYLIFDQYEYEPETKLHRFIQEYSCWHSN